MKYVLLTQLRNGYELYYTYYLSLNKQGYGIQFRKTYEWDNNTKKTVYIQ